MRFYYKLIKTYPNSAELGTIFYTDSKLNSGKVFTHGQYSLLEFVPNLVQNDLASEFFEESFKMSEDGYPLFEGDIVTIMNQVTFTHPASYNDDAKFYKFATNIKFNE